MLIHQLYGVGIKGYLRKIEVGGKRLYRESDVEAI